MNALSTDRQILECIYQMYRDAYPRKKSGDAREKIGPYLPIDVTDVAMRLGCLPELLFGRLYYHLDAKYRYEQDDGAKVHLFALKVGPESHCVNFPYLVALLAEKDQEHYRQLWSVWLSVAALILSVAAIVAQVVISK